jgi:hypothetical protein
VHSERVRHFALVGDVPSPTKARSQSLSRSGTQSDPCISSIAASTMIPSSNSSVRMSGTPQSITRCSTAHHGDFRAVPRVDRICLPARSRIPCASSRTAEWLNFDNTRSPRFVIRRDSPLGFYLVRPLRDMWFYTVRVKRLAEGSTIGNFTSKP